MAACQAVDTLAVNLPPDKFMPALLSHVQPALQRTDGGAPGMTKAAFNALAVSAEGCSEYIRTKKYLGSFLQVGAIFQKHGWSRLATSQYRVSYICSKAWPLVSFPLIWGFHHLD